MSNSYSLLRTAEYTWLRSLTVSGKVLDLGGGEFASYRTLWSGLGEYVSVNIDPEIHPTIVASAEESLSLPSDSFDYAICLNVLEHVYKPHAVIANAFKHLAPHGRFIGAVPFMHQIHGSPDDYYRYTSSAVKRMLEECGFGKVEIIPLALGPLQLLVQFFGLHRQWRRIGMWPLVWLDSILLRSQAYYRLALRVPQGYGFVAVKSPVRLTRDS